MQLVVGSLIGIGVAYLTILLIKNWKYLCSQYKRKIKWQTRYE
jgi:hypothetical protein